jgi:hypothetical protein
MSIDQSLRRLEKAITLCRESIRSHEMGYSGEVR